MKGTKLFIGGMLVGAALMVSVSAAADSLSLIGKKVTSETEVYLDGKPFDTAPVINGTSLAPLRKAYEAAGFKVEYRDQKVYLQSPVKEETNPVNQGNSASQQADEKKLQGEIDFLKIDIHKLELQLLPSFNKSDAEKADIQKDIETKKSLLTELEKKLATLNS